MGRYAFIIVIFALVVAMVVARTTVPSDIDTPTSGGSGSGLSTTAFNPQTSLLAIEAAVFCTHDGRETLDGAGSRGLSYNIEYYHDGTVVDDPDEEHIKADEPFWWFHNPPDFKWQWNNEPTCVLDGLSETSPQSNIYAVSFEGECNLYGRTRHDLYEAADYERSFDSGWIEDPEFSYNVDWDTNQAQCEAIGGAWLAAAGYDGYRCCGDDWIWINNMAVDYAPRDAYARLTLSDKDELCLYSMDQGDVYGDGKSTDMIFGLTNSYICDYASMEDHLAYDSNLELDDVLGESTIGKPASYYHFLDIGDYETDIGKWSNGARTDAMFCDVYFHPTDGVTFRWLPMSQAQNLGQLYCEVYLGYNWTGSQCCGAPGVAATYNDPVPECNGRSAASSLYSAGSRDKQMSRITFAKEFEKKCEVKDENRACYNMKSLDNNSIMPSDESLPDTKNILNNNGNLYACQGAEVSGLETDSKCQIRGSASEFAICAYRNDSWITHNEAADYLAYVAKNPATNKIYTLPELQQVVHLSAVPAAVPASARAGFSLDNECCFSGCWDGTQCVGDYAVYQLENEEWEEYSGSLNANKQVFICFQGEWRQNDDAQLDWFKNTDQPWFCLGEEECVCQVGADGCPEQYVYKGCTNTDGLSIKDHFCESNEWTSRTKVLAAQLISMAPGDYTLFCDQYDKSINYFEPFKKTPENVNSICALDTGGQIILGTTFNAEDPAEFDVASVFFDPSTGFVTTVLGDNSVVNCNNAVDNADSSQYGTFRRCLPSNGMYYYNNRTQTLIWSDKLVSSSNELSSGYAAGNSFIESQFQKIAGHINANVDTINAHERIMNIQIFEGANSFARLYVSKQGSTMSFGTIEKLYDSELQTNRNYLGVLYEGLGIKCSEIMDANAYCGEESGRTIVLYRNEADSFPYWSDLTAKLRFG
jgi:hypothetical protein